MSETVKKTWKIKIIFQATFCSLTVILTALYALGLKNGVNLTTVNVLCLSFYFTQLAPGLIDSINKQKAQWLLAAVFISACVTSLNLWINYQTLSEFHLSTLSGWCFTWMLLLLLASVTTINILIRLFRWSQEQWEEVRKIRQQYRKEAKESRIKMFSSRNAHSLDMLKSKQEQQKNVQEIKENLKIELLTFKARLQKNRLWINFFKVKSVRSVEDSPKPNKFIHLSGFKPQLKRAIIALLLCTVIGIFFLLPLFDNWSGYITIWIQSVENSHHPPVQLGGGDLHMVYAYCPFYDLHSFIIAERLYDIPYIGPYLAI